MQILPMTLVALAMVLGARYIDDKANAFASPEVEPSPINIALMMESTTRESR